MVRAGEVPLTVDVKLTDERVQHAKQGHPAEYVGRA